MSCVARGVVSRAVLPKKWVAIAVLTCVAAASFSFAALASPTTPRQPGDSAPPKISPDGPLFWTDLPIAENDPLLASVPTMTAPKSPPPTKTNRDDSHSPKTTSANGGASSDDSLLVPIPAIGAGWALIMLVGMYQIGARSLRLRR